jgi:hypothetical protein
MIAAAVVVLVALAAFVVSSLRTRDAATSTPSKKPGSIAVLPPCVLQGCRFPGLF